ncbi:hypothetical protein DFH06DRAFT_1467514 [Mycena polygramma]|nr:hypothetical protein DFH06DRAFT_1467514 [Mycena polygramma]
MQYLRLGARRCASDLPQASAPVCAYARQLPHQHCAVALRPSTTRSTGIARFAHRPQHDGRLLRVPARRLTNGRRALCRGCWSRLVDIPPFWKPPPPCRVLRASSPTCTSPDSTRSPYDTRYARTGAYVDVPAPLFEEAHDLRARSADLESGCTCRHSGVIGVHGLLHMTRGRKRNPVGARGRRKALPKEEETRERDCCRPSRRAPESVLRLVLRRGKTSEQAQRWTRVVGCVALPRVMSRPLIFTTLMSRSRSSDAFVTSNATHHPSPRRRAYTPLDIWPQIPFISGDPTGGAIGSRLDSTHHCIIAFLCTHLRSHHIHTSLPRIPRIHRSLRAIQVKYRAQFGIE